jgi:hypothetical protein
MTDDMAYDSVDDSVHAQKICSDHSFFAVFQRCAVGHGSFFVYTPGRPQ